MHQILWCYSTDVFTGGEESSPSVESLINWLLEHDDTVLDELSDDSDVLLSYMDDSWSDQESVLIEDVADDEVCDACVSRVTVRRAGLVLRWVTTCVYPSFYLPSHTVQLGSDLDRQVPSVNIKSVIKT